MILFRQQGARSLLPEVAVGIEGKPISVHFGLAGATRKVYIQPGLSRLRAKAAHFSISDWLLKK